MKAEVRSIVADAPAVSVWAETEPTAAGARLAGVTATAASSDADSPPGSVAVMVTVVWPAATAEIVRTLPETDTVATAVFELVAP